MCMFVKVGHILTLLLANGETTVLMFLSDSASRAHLADILAKLPSPEYVLLLSSIVNMAVLCPDNAKGLVECITLHLLEVWCSGIQSSHLFCCCVQVRC